ncbi:MAG TPA: hypothetical protein VFK37_06070, partial [Bacillales bacterium]|nr:hypothetical protein [Bacillales bacterium]
MNLRTVLSSLKTMKSNGAGKITLIKGQIFSGKILKLFPNSQALVQLGGLQVHAKLEVSLEAGKSYWLQVANSNGTPELRVIEDKETQLPARNTIDALFEKMGIGSTKNRETVVRTFMNAELPFSKEMIIKSGEWLKTVESQADALKVIKEMAAKQLPFSRAVFQSLLIGEQGEPISKQIARLAQALENSAETSEPAKKLAALLPGLTLEATDSSSANKQSLQHVIARLGLSYEHTLLQSEEQSTFRQDALKQTLQQILQQTNVSPELKQQATQLLSQLSSESALTASSLQKMIQPELEQVLNRIMAQTDSSEPTQNALKLTDTLKPLLMQIVQQTHSSDVRQSAQQLLGQLTSQQLNAIGPFQTII